MNRPPRFQAGMTLPTIGSRMSIDDLSKPQRDVYDALCERGPCTLYQLTVYYNQWAAVRGWEPQEESGIRTHVARMQGKPDETGLTEKVGTDPTGSKTGRSAKLWQAV